MLHERVQVVARKALAANPQEDVAQWFFDAWDAIARLNGVARDMDNPSVDLDMIDAPLTVGGTRFWRLSPVAQEKAFGELLEWFEAGEVLPLAAVLYCMAHSRDRLALARLSSPTKARRLVRSWFMQQKASVEALNAVAEALLPRRREDAEEEQPAEPTEDYLGRMVAVLCREYGQTPDFWLYECSVDRVAALLAEYGRRAEEELRTRVALAGFKTVSMDGPEARASMRFLKESRAFLAKYGALEARP